MVVVVEAVVVVLVVDGLIVLAQFVLQHLRGTHSCERGLSCRQMGLYDRIRLSERFPSGPGSSFGTMITYLQSMIRYLLPTRLFGGIHVFHAARACCSKDTPER